MRHLLAFAVASFAVLLLITFSGNLLAYSNISAGWWMRDLIRLTDDIADHSEGPRLIIVSGSNGFLGFDGDLLQKQTGRKVINFAINAGLDLNFYIDRLRAHLRPSDIVLLPLEHAYYKKVSPTGYEQLQYLAWMQSEFGLKSPLESLVYNTEIPSEIYANLILSRLLLGKKDVAAGDLASIKKRQIAFRKSGRRDPDLIYVTRADDHGFVYDKELPQGILAPTFFVKQTPYPGWKWSVVPQFARDGFSRLRQVVEHAGARAIFTWPTEMRHGRNLPEDDANIAPRYAFAKEFIQTGFEMACDPRDSIFPYHMFLDSEYHLNALGATARTVVVVNCLARMNLAKKIDAKANLKNLDDLQRLSDIRRARHAPLFDFEQITTAIIAVRRRLAVRKLPSQDWQAETVELTTAPGEFPADAKLLYKSDGKDFKILSIGAKGCEAMTTIVPSAVEILYPKCTFGYATPGARTWMPKLFP